MFVARSFLFILFFYCLLQYPMYGLPCWSGRRSIAVVCVLLISFILLVLTKLDRSFILAALYINSSPVMWSHHEMPNTVPRRLWWKTSSMCEIVVVRFHASASQILLVSSLLVQTYSLMVMLMSLLVHIRRTCCQMLLCQLWLVCYPLWRHGFQDMEIVYIFGSLVWCPVVIWIEGTVVVWLSSLSSSRNWYPVLPVHGV